MFEELLSSAELAVAVSVGGTPAASLVSSSGVPSSPVKANRTTKPGQAAAAGDNKQKCSMKTPTKTPLSHCWRNTDCRAIFRKATQERWQ